MDSLLRLAPYLLMLLAACATPTDRYREARDKPAVIVLCAVNVAGTLPWVCAELVMSSAKWPQLVSSGVTFLTVIAAVLLLRRKKKPDSDEKGNPAS